MPRLMQNIKQLVLELGTEKDLNECLAEIEKLIDDEFKHKASQLGYELSPSEPMNRSNLNETD